MKKLTIISALFISINCFGQQDSLPAIPDSVQYISQKHIQLSYKNLTEKLNKMEDKLTVAQYNRLMEGIKAAYEELINVASEDYQKKKKPVR